MTHTIIKRGHDSKKCLSQVRNHCCRAGLTELQLQDTCKVRCSLTQKVPITTFSRDLLPTK